MRVKNLKQSPKITVLCSRYPTSMTQIMARKSEILQPKLQARKFLKFQDLGFEAK